MPNPLQIKASANIRRLAAASAALVASTLGGAALAADGAWTHEVVYTADVAGPVQGGTAVAGRYLDNLDLIGDLDLEKATGWSGATAHIHVLNNSGGTPNDLAGTIQGINNIEVGRARLRLFEAWVEQSFLNGKASLRAGLYDLNSEFYANDAAGLLINPAFGIGSELAATGVNGPSIFPSTTLALRFKFENEQAYAQAAVLNARAGTLGDPKGINTTLDHGALLIAEAGLKGPTKLAIGGWRYTDHQDDIRDLDLAGDPVQQTAQGAYLLAEHAFTADDAQPAVHGFLRVGISDGDTGAFRGGWQAGLLVERVFAGRPDSQFSIGFQEGFLSRKQRANEADAGLDVGRAESGVEITFSDKLGEHLTVQPDLQYIVRPAGDRDAEDVLVVGLRLTLEL